MSKSSLDSSDHDRIPTYEEALASTSTSPSRTTSGTSSIRQERIRRILDVVTKFITPCFATHVSNLCNHLTIVLVPADALPTSTKVTEQNVVSPSLHTHQTTGNVVTLTGAGNLSSFWTQTTVVQELDQIIRRELTGSVSVEETATRPVTDEKVPSLTSPPLQVQPAPGSSLPPRPNKTSWLKRTFVLPGEDHDPTGETGQWNLGWRSPSSPDSSTNQHTWTSRPKDKIKPLQPDEVAVHSRLQDVSFRTENEMGLLETTTVKCIWIEIEVGT